ncbi:oxidoreductase, streptomycin biosynthesis protein (strI-related protein) [Lentisphaera araneosa HTCC2155]|uniref:Oxidoreductase, streptomycin biosynthesis protein (StrI-related protein) n=1 Tax=Lentisphaera araneosa HTCC2155 TaxID=313628 RepID=A6DPW1_9BACT|nr:Gfo/Idh/MocA family oxidoreductase [Lentisphaera araneosa]EDM26406.1 oxidoreductase, streptomycin biosynthesis protein (strI-related protein) [Lentisphaera araneosa HTCC2155]
MKKLKLACIGCGSRGRTYLGLASKMAQYYEIVAAAEPSKERLEHVKNLSHNPDFQGFENDDEIFAQPKLADVMIIATQDSMHIKSCLTALEKGYDILVEKPIGTNLKDIIKVEKCAEKLGRKVLVCHVLRYTPFYRKVKELVESGVLGDIASVNMSEGVGAFHQSHSYVRGHWGVKEKSSPMLIAKSCHDLDILCWLVGRSCKEVSSFGDLMHFNKKNAPEGAPARYTDGCPAGIECPYNATRYASSERSWLPHVWPVYDENNPAPDEDVIEWLKESPWGRCVYHCDNNVVDHQVVNMLFEDNLTASFTMTAFDHGRNIEIFGTKACLRGGELIKQATGSDIIIKSQFDSEESSYVVDPMVGGYGGHGGGDPGLVNALYDEMGKDDPKDMYSSVHVSVQSHLIGFAAEESRVSGNTIDIESFYQSNLPND